MQFVCDDLHPPKALIPRYSLPQSNSRIELSRVPVVLQILRKIN